MGRGISRRPYFSALANNDFSGLNTNMQTIKTHVILIHYGKLVLHAFLRFFSTCICTITSKMRTIFKCPESHHLHSSTDVRTCCLISPCTSKLEGMTHEIDCTDFSHTSHQRLNASTSRSYCASRHHWQQQGPQEPWTCWNPC